MNTMHGPTIDPNTPEGKAIDNLLQHSLTMETLERGDVAYISIGGLLVFMPADRSPIKRYRLVEV